MKRSWTRAAIVGAAGVAVLLPAAATPASAARPVPGGGTAVGDPAAQVLGEIADTPANRTQIAINNLAALWHSAALPRVPSLLDVESPKGKGFEASNEIIVSSALGTGQIAYNPQNPAPYGYNILSLSQEVVVGSIPDELTEVSGPIETGAVGSALRKLKAAESRTGSTQLFDLRAAASRKPINYMQLQGITRFALPGGGGRLVGAGAQFPESALTGLAEGKTQKNSLASDPAVSQLLAVFPSDATTMTMGTSFAGGYLGGRIAPERLRELRATSGLGKVHASTFGGLAFSGPPNAARVTAAAVYPNAADAKVAAAAVGAYLRTGINPLTNRRWSGLWQLTGTSTHGDTAVVELTTKTPQDVTNTIGSDDFPLFWKL